MTADLSCLRCSTRLQFAGTKKFHEGSRGWGFALGDFGELFTNRESFDIYGCPSCGHAELFFEGVGDRPAPGAEQSDALLPAEDRGQPFPHQIKPPEPY